MSTRIAQRYDVEKILGKGGTSIVYQVFDIATARRLALKRLTVERQSPKYEEVAALFEYEFYTLTQLSHPRVIEVYDFGKDENGPYYTMELLEGGDLRDLSPLAWRKACSFFYDVCSALGLLHSRRRIHRDLSPSNLRCTRDGTAKLIDFGAMAPMGPCKQVIGTPPLTAPEVLNLQSLDARADLFSLGAALYYGLTGRHAYPARKFADLRDLWRSIPRAPSMYVSDIPKELDDLVLALLSIDRTARPVNAAEVMEKLSAIGDLKIRNQLFVGQAYLSTPTLVGRNEQVMRVRKLLGRAFRGHGGALLIDGDAGIGRSRFLDACVLEGKLGGAVVLKADAADSRTGVWGAVRALVSTLLKSIPEIAIETVKPYLSVLTHAFPEFVTFFDEQRADASPKSSDAQNAGPSSASDPLGKAISSIPPQPFNTSQEIRPRVQAALRDWLLQICERRSLMVAIDDIHRLDEPSAAFITLLAHQVSQKMLLVVVTADSKAPATSAAALRLVRTAGVSIKLRELSLEQTQELLDSVFGDVPNVRLLADRLYTVTRGNPGAVMQLTQHLVDNGLVRYQSGAWILPGAIDAGDLPENMNEALRTRLTKLSAESLALAQSLALRPERGFTFEECLLLLEHGEVARLIGKLDELVIAEVFSTDGGFYTLSQPALVPELTSSLSETRRQILHARLADTIEKRSRFAKTIEKRGTEEFFVIQHLLEAGFRERALDLSLKCFETLRPHLLQNQQAFDAYVQSLPKNWIETFETLLQACEELGRPKKERFSLETALVALDSVGVSANQAHLGSVLSQLYHDSGLGDYQRLDASLAPPDRISRALQIAQERYDASSAAERVNPPLEAMGFLAQNIISALSIGATSFDCSFIASLPSLEPLIPVSTAFMVIDKHVQSTFYLTAARMEESRKGYLEVLELLNKPDRGGIDETYYEYARLTAMYAAGLIEASLGMRSALRWLDTFEAYPFFQANGVRIRMVYYLRQGDTKKAEECKKRLELLQIQNSPSQIFAGGYLLPEVLVYSSSDDLNGISQTLDGIQNMATRFKTWKPILLYARGEYQRVRGDYQKSLSELQEALSLVKPGQHVIWPYLASAYIGTLCDVETFQQARDLGREFLAAALEFGLGISSNLIARSLSLAEGALGEYDTAVQRLQSAIEQYEQAEITGLSPGLVYETRARLAIMMADTPGFSHFARQCAEQYQPGHNPALTAKYEKLMHEAARATLRVSDDLAHAADFYDLTTATAVTLVTGFLGDCRGPKERADRALELLVEQSHCIGGFLYTLQKQGPVLVAQNGVTTVPAEMDAMVVSYLAAEMEDVGGITLSSDTIVKSVEETSQWTVAQREQYRPLVLGHLSNDGYRITGLAVLVRDPARLFAVPGDAVTALSKSLFDAGDVTALVATG